MYFVSELVFGNSFQKLPNHVAKHFFWQCTYLLVNNLSACNKEHGRNSICRSTRDEPGGNPNAGAGRKGPSLPKNFEILGPGWDDNYTFRQACQRAPNVNNNHSIDCGPVSRPIYLLSGFLLLLSELQNEFRRLDSHHIYSLTWQDSLFR